MVLFKLTTQTRSAWSHDRRTQSVRVPSDYGAKPHLRSSCGICWSLSPGSLVLAQHRERMSPTSWAGRAGRGAGLPLTPEDTTASVSI